jgi:hypothetical protein
MGIYSIHVLSTKRLRAFLEAIPSEYSRMDIHLNEQNKLPADSPFQIEELKNHQMLLTDSYEKMSAHFAPEMREALTLAEESDLLPTTSLKPERVAEMYQKYTPDKKRVDQKFHALQRIMYNALHRGWGFASGVQTRDGELLASNFYLYSHKKVISLVPMQSPEGASKAALPYLFDILLRSHAGRPLILDFNGQHTGEMAVQFGATDTAYYRVRSGKEAWWKFW